MGTVIPRFENANGRTIIAIDIARMIEGKAMNQRGMSGTLLCLQRAGYQLGVDILNLEETVNRKESRC